MTPDGPPVVDWNREAGSLLHATGTRRQGYLLGPGIGGSVSRMTAHETSGADAVILSGVSLYRDFSGAEALK